MSTIDDLVALTPDLASLGWDDELETWAAEVAAEIVDGTTTPGRIARSSRGFSLVFTGGDALLAASGSHRTDVEVVPATGDFVVVRHDPDDGPRLAAIAPRRSALQRRAPGRVPEPQVLAANTDTALILHGLDRDLNLRRLERQLVVAWDSGAEPMIALTKADVAHDPQAEVEAVTAIAPGVEVVATSTVSGQGLDRVQARFSGTRAAALLGLSGVGKSSLVNALSDGVVQLTGEVRAADRRGRHTTVTRDLIPLPSGGFVIDTPGVREIGLWQAYEGMERAFPEIAQAAAACRFADCDHEAEPGCGVRQALADGTISEARLDHWRHLAAELALQETQLTEFARRAESRQRADAEDRRDRVRPKGARGKRKPRSGGKGRRRRR